jgi:alpha-beta hydrolase superfamily lysophospholipase
MMYETEKAWRELQLLVPEKNRLTEKILPVEKYRTFNEIDVHLDEYECGSDTTVIVFHGVGGNGRIVSFFAIPLLQEGYNVLCPDLPGYGFTRYWKKIRYRDWIEVGSRIAEEELAKSRKVFLIGLSAGGMVAYNVACLNSGVSGLIVTNILDSREEEVRLCSAKNEFQARFGIKFLNMLPEFMRNFKIPIRMVTNMNGLVNDEKVLKVLLKDKRGPGSNVDINFLLSMMNNDPVTEPESFASIPVLMAHPGNDLWTPVRVSDIFFNKLASDKQRVILDKAGHFPIEEPGLSQMENAIKAFIKKHSGYGLNRRAHSS